ncbi:MAG: hypothetical protein E1N59_2305 [Puniceicoccaceae bacterium 5H]|nr:MAG: hypothetical protein E1N59_2305 [Puniceicoccaceae bacterium 5H]
MEGITERLKRYPIYIAWSEEDGAYIASIPSLPGCISDGPTPEAAAHNIQEALSGCLEALVANGYPLPSA